MLTHESFQHFGSRTILLVAYLKFSGMFLTFVNRLMYGLTDCDGAKAKGCSNNVCFYLYYLVFSVAENSVMIIDIG